MVIPPSDKEMDYQPAGPLSLDDRELMVEAALSGAALAYVWEDHLRSHSKAGVLSSAWPSGAGWRIGSIFVFDARGEALALAATRKSEQAEPARTRR